LGSELPLACSGGRSIDVDGFTIIHDGQINARGTGVFDGQWYFVEHGIGAGPFPADILALDPDGVGTGCEFGGEVWNGRIVDTSAS
jgi:hypothetical protein